MKSLTPLFSADFIYNFQTFRRMGVVLFLLIFVAFLSGCETVPSADEIVVIHDREELRQIYEESMTKYRYPALWLYYGSDNAYHYLMGTVQGFMHGYWLEFYKVDKNALPFTQERPYYGFGTGKHYERVFVRYKYLDEPIVEGSPLLKVEEKHGIEYVP